MWWELIGRDNAEPLSLKTEIGGANPPSSDSISDPIELSGSVSNKLSLLFGIEARLCLDPEGGILKSLAKGPFSLVMWLLGEILVSALSGLPGDAVNASVRKSFEYECLVCDVGVCWLGECRFGECRFGECLFGE